MTPLEQYQELAKKIGKNQIYFKREDLHKYQSHKGRSIPVMIKHYYDQNKRKFAISSSGNAGLASALYTNDFNSKNSEKIELQIYVGNNVNKNKLQKLRQTEDVSGGQIKVLIKERPLIALNQALEEGYTSLRQSTDDIALIGYDELASEICQTKDIGAIFIGTSSGTTAQALGQYVIDNKYPIQIHIVQTSSCHPIADQFENYDGPEEKSLADAIVAKTTERLPKLVEIIKKTNGYAWTATNQDIEIAKKIVVESTNLSISNNSALSIVGIMQANYRSWPITGKVICLICGE
jgi:threonine dehydratase